MNHESKNIWTKPRKGPRETLFCGLIISLAAALFAAAVTASAYIMTPDNVLIWAGVDATAVGIWQTPGLVPALIAMQVMGLFIGLAVPAFMLYCGVKWLVRRAMSRSPGAIIATTSLRQQS